MSNAQRLRNDPMRELERRRYARRRDTVVAWIVWLGVLAILLWWVSSAWGQVDEAFEYHAEHEGACMVISVDETVRYSRCANGYTLNDSWPLHSGTKAFWGPVAQKLIEEGYLPGVSFPIGAILPTWRHSPWSAIDFVHVQQLTMGTRPKYSGEPPDLYEDVANFPITNPDGVLYPPGTVFQYDSVPFNLLGAMTRDRLSGTLVDYLRVNFLDPLGISYTDWKLDQVGNPYISRGAELKPLEWLKWGEFLISDGKGVLRPEQMRILRYASGVNPGHGLYLWLNMPGGFGPTPDLTSLPTDPGGMFYRDGYPRMVVAAGAGEQRMYAIPELGIVIVRQSDKAQVGQFKDHEFLSILLRRVPNVQKS